MPHKLSDTERTTQNNLIEFFKNTLDYTYYGNWHYREHNSNIEKEYLEKFLKEKQRYSDDVIKRAVDKLIKAASAKNKNLYDLNKEVYTYLRYGIQVKGDDSRQNETVWLIDWKNPSNNEFGIAEEVTIQGETTNRPDIVLYVNGIALGVIELKKSTVSISEGIRQNLKNQDKRFIEHFFTTIQLVMAGQDIAGLHYGVIETPETYYLNWKESSTIENKLHRQVFQMCNKERFLELIHDFIIFDKGIKKVCRHNQYFGVKAAQPRVINREDDFGYTEKLLIIKIYLILSKMQFMTIPKGHLMIMIRKMSQDF